MAEQEFDLKLSRQLRRLAADYSVHFQPGEVICDDATADAAFQAAVELLGDVGLYNVDTNRIIFLGREELEATCRDTPKQFTRGAGKDAVTVRARSHNSPVAPHAFRWPLTHSRYLGKEAFLFELLPVYASDPTELGDLARELGPRLAGVENKVETVGDTMWAAAAARWCLAVARVTGHPDMFVGTITTIGVPATLACFMGDGLYQKHHSGISVATMPELKINWDRLQLAFIARQMGLARFIGGVSILGAYARNAEETAILSTATVLAQLSYTNADWANMALIDVDGYRSRRRTLTAQSGAIRAVERHIGLATTGLQTPRNGLGSALSLYEKAAMTIEQTCSGISWTWHHPYHPGPGGEPKSDLDYELVDGVARAVSGMEREQANDLLNRIVAVYEERWDVLEKGKPYAYYYDLKTLTPRQELVDLYRRVEGELAGLGLPL